MDHHPHDPTLIQPVVPAPLTPEQTAQAASHCVSPLASAAESIIRLEDNYPKELGSAPVEQTLNLHASNIAEGNFAHLEQMMTAQAQMLHAIFAASTQNYAVSSREERIRLHSGVALKAQSYCRMTVAELSKLREEKQRLAALKGKAQNELIAPQITT